MVSHIKLEQAHAIFKARRYPVGKTELLKQLECSESTLKRVIKALREQYDAPLLCDRTQGSYWYSDEKFELSSPGAWLNPDTLLAMVSMQKLLAQLQLDFLDQSLNQLWQQIEIYLKRKKLNTHQLDRIRILPINARIHQSSLFQKLTAALLQRQCLHITYYGRGSDQISERIISPQRLAHYKDNWYLDAWCHLRQEMRMFALDGIQEVQPDKSVCIEIAEAELDTLLASSYGIFSGTAMHTAVLRFSAKSARWVASEQWHPNQIASWCGDGRYQLEIPYADARELLMDIQRHLPEVEIVSPPELKQALLKRLQQTMQQYEKN